MHFKKTQPFFKSLIIDNKLSNFLELDISHGTVTCYIAAALQELREVSVTAFDLIMVKNHFNPSAEEQLKNTGLSENVNIFRM